MSANSKPMYIEKELDSYKEWLKPGAGGKLCCLSAECHVSMDDFLICSLICKKAATDVYRVIDYTDRKFYCLKSQRISRNETQIERELSLLKKVSNHPYFVDIFHAFRSGDFSYFVIELLSCNLEQMSKHEDFGDDDIGAVTVRIAEAVKHLHTFNIVGVDIKPGNIMFNRDGDLKLIDFGLSFDLDNSKESRLHRGTKYFTAPEVMNKQFCYKNDTFSVGVCVLSMLSENFRDDFEFKLSCLKDNNESDFKTALDGDIKDLKDIIWQSMRIKQSDRITIDQFLEHKYLSEYTINFSDYSDRLRKLVCVAMGNIWFQNNDIFRFDSKEKTTEENIQTIIKVNEKLSAQISANYPNHSLRGVDFPVVFEGNDFGKCMRPKCTCKTSTKDLSMNAFIGKGSPGKVFKATVNGEEVAVKVYLKTVENSRVATNEINVLNKLKHPLFVRLLHVYETKIFLYLCLELCKNNMEQLDEWKDLNKMNEYKTQGISAWVFKALGLLKKQRIIHTNLKPRNILFTDAGNIKISGFGKCLDLDRDDSTVYKSNLPPWVPPEVTRKLVTMKSPFWSLGTILYRLTTGNFVVGDESMSVENYFKTIYHTPVYKTICTKLNECTCSFDWKVFLSSLLTLPEEKRIGNICLPETTYHDYINAAMVLYDSNNLNTLDECEPNLSVYNFLLYY
ncbi:Ribosomal protein S6 kinase alpha-2 [Bonamia ostreae]|uniref:non-specific serine/threonine protein kinase n=1 Tax=Bonamia ostreae TaxID=126728 RepID=A0ABV2AE27_9EUKA